MIFELYQDKSRRLMETDEFQLKSRSFFVHPEYKRIKDSHNFDVCLIKTVDEFHVIHDLSSNFETIPCLPKHVNLQKV